MARLMLEEAVQRFLSSGSGDGYGSGSGSGDGSGSGSGYGSGSGSGDGSGLEEINGERIYQIDDVQTVIRSVHGNVAKGVIVNGDLTLTPCFVVKQDNLFAHGETLREAMEALRDKLFEDMPEAERIEAFMAEHELHKAYPNRDLYDWHHRLTGSCDMGRRTFVADHGIDMDGETTVDEFIRLTENAYGGEVIRRLKERYEHGCK